MVAHTYSDECESGFGIVEILVAMMLFAILLMAAAPVLVNSLRNAADNAARGAASQLANEQIAAARLAQGSCEAFKVFVAQPTPDVTDSRGNTFRITVTSEFASDYDTAVCLATPRSYAYSVSVSRSSDAAGVAPLITTSTLLAVPGLD